MILILRLLLVLIFLLTGIYIAAFCCQASQQKKDDTKKGAVINNMENYTRKLEKCPLCGGELRDSKVGHFYLPKLRTTCTCNSCGVIVREYPPEEGTMPDIELCPPSESFYAVAGPSKKVGSITISIVSPDINDGDSLFADNDIPFDEEETAEGYARYAAAAYRISEKIHKLLEHDTFCENLREYLNGEMPSK